MKLRESFAKTSHIGMLFFNLFFVSSEKNKALHSFNTVYELLILTVLTKYVLSNFKIVYNKKI